MSHESDLADEAAAELEAVTPPADDGQVSGTPVEINTSRPDTSGYAAYVFSASRLKTWMQCPMKAHLHYDVHAPERQSGKASFGTIIHICLDLYNQTGNIHAALDLFDDLWTNPEKAGVEPEWWPKMTTWDGLRQRGREVLRVFHEQLNWDKREVLASEHRFLVPFGRYLLTGSVDLLEIRRSGNGRELLRIVDYKTASRRPTKAELYLDIQFTIYMYASLQPEFWTGYPDNPEFPGLPNGEWLFECHTETPRRPIWFHLWDQKEIDAGDRDDNDFMKLYQLCTQVERSDRAGIHIPRIGDACGLCDFNEICGLEIPTPEQVREQENAWI